MNDGRFGIWLIGAWGNVATTVAVGLLALQNDLIDTASLISEQPKFSRLDLANWNCFGAVGGHEIRRTSFLVEARHLASRSSDQSGGFSSDLLAQIAPGLEAFDKNVRTGTLINVAPDTASRATTAAIKTRGEWPGLAVDRIAADITEFKTANSLEHVIVVNLASLEPAMELEYGPFSWSELPKFLEAHRSPLPASTLYAMAALASGCSYINFTLSRGSDLPPLKILAQTSGVLHMGCDGKLGESFFPGAAVLDAVRFCERERRRKKSGEMTFLSEFFHHPMGSEKGELDREATLLDRWSDEVAREG